MTTTAPTTPTAATLTTAATTVPEAHNRFTGQGAVLLDIGGTVGALVVTMPAALEGQEVEIRPVGSHREPHSHLLHVAVVGRRVQTQVVHSLVFGELEEGRYELYVRPDGPVKLLVDVRGGEVSTATWPQ